MFVAQYTAAFSPARHGLQDYRRSSMHRIILLFLSVSLLVINSSRADEASKLYKEKIQPLFQRKCYDCHSAKADEVKSGLKLDTLEDILKGGSTGPAIVPGEPDNSFLLKTIRYEEQDYQMPPAGKLDDKDIQAVERWIREFKADSKQQK